MRTVITASLLVLAAVAVWSSCNPVAETDPVPDIVVPPEDPIAAIGHGAFVASDGRELEPDRDLILTAQAYYIAELEDPGALGATDPTRPRTLVYGLVSDRILANAVYIDWLAEVAETPRLAHIVNANHALRWHYWLEILGNPRPTVPEWTKGLDPSVADELERNDVPGRVLLQTNAGGEAYMAECRDAGVPIPDAMYSDEWENMGEFTNEFLEDGWEAELWVHRSDAPAGFCLALPRYDESCDGGGACLLGVICLGTETNNACFLDNPIGTYFPRNVEVSMTEFKAGADLVANGQGTCSDCHAGENPYVVHPAKPAFADIPAVDLQPSGWHNPLVDPMWPQNPGPTNLLDAIPSTGQCNSCHDLGFAGRFPEVSTELGEYCRVVLGTAKGTGTKATMPPRGNRSQYLPHINALEAACGAAPSPGGVIVDVDFEDDPDFISPPIVIDPCYQCATQVAVKGAIIGARVELFIDGVPVAEKEARSTVKVEFDVPELTAGEVIEALQEVDGVITDTSPQVIVRDHRVDFPGGLPAPEIDPELLHECGDILAIRHVPGSTITVFSNGADARSRSTSTGWSALRPGKRPFEVGDAFTAQQTLCDDPPSPVGPEATAVAAPSSIGAPSLDPTETYAGQKVVTITEIVHGARVTVAEASAGDLGSFTWPVTWFPDWDVETRLGSPLGAGDQLIVMQELCDARGEWEAPPAVGCEELPAPRIRHPRVGDEFVVVTESVPGARIRVYDDSGNELGDGSGTVVLLNRAITGADTLTVVQQVGECTSATGYRISVRNPDNPDDTG